MTNLFEIFNPNAAHWRRQRDLDKVAVVPTRNGAQGPMRIDLDKGTIMLPARKDSAEFVTPEADAPEPDTAESDTPEPDAGEADTAEPDVPEQTRQD